MVSHGCILLSLNGLLVLIGWHGNGKEPFRDQEVLGPHSGRESNKLIGLLLCLQIFEKNPTRIDNYGIWLRYQSRTGYHNMYKEYRDTTLNGAVEQMYNEMASRHRVRFPCIQIIKTATIPAKLCKRESTKQFHNSKIKFPLVFRKVRPPSRKLKTTYKASKPNLFMWSIPILRRGWSDHWNLSSSSFGRTLFCRGFQVHFLFLDIKKWLLSLGVFRFAFLCLINILPTSCWIYINTFYAYRLSLPFKSNTRNR